MDYTNNNSIIAAMIKQVVVTGADFYKHNIQVLVVCLQKLVANDSDNEEKKQCFEAKHLLYPTIVLLHTL